MQDVYVSPCMLWLMVTSHIQYLHVLLCVSVSIANLRLQASDYCDSGHCMM
jgi:hypothetical protein